MVAFLTSQQAVKIPRTSLMAPQKCLQKSLCMVFFMSPGSYCGTLAFGGLNVNIQRRLNIYIARAPPSVVIYFLPHFFCGGLIWPLQMIWQMHWNCATCLVGHFLCLITWANGRDNKSSAQKYILWKPWCLGRGIPRTSLQRSRTDL